MPYFSFVMVCYNNWNFTQSALDTFFESLDPQHQKMGIELIMVNNGCSDETARGLEEYKRKLGADADIITVYLEKNLGYIIGVNTGLSKCSGEIIGILNNDLIFCPGWLNGMLGFLEDNPEAGVVAPLLTNGSGPENIILKFKSPEQKQAFYQSKEIMNYYAKQFMHDKQDLVIYTSRLVGACMILKRKILELIGGLDYWFGIGIFDDDDFSIRVNIAGYKTAIVGSSFVYHVGNATFSQVRDTSNAAVIANKMKFIHKWQIKCTENTQGLYNSREEAIRSIAFDIEKHFMLLSLEQFNSFQKKKFNENNDDRNLLLVADWTNSKSLWLKKLEVLLPQVGEKEKIYLWIPPTYFSKEESNAVAGSIHPLLEPGIQVESLLLKYLCMDINSADLPAFIASFDVVISVEDDFVNRYVVYLAEQIGVQVV